MWIEWRAGRRLSRLADAAAPERSGGAWSPNHGQPTTAPRRHCAFHTGGEPFLPSETVAFGRAASLPLRRHSRKSRTPAFRSRSVRLDCAIGADPILGPKAWVYRAPAPTLAGTCFCGRRGAGMAIVLTPLSSQRKKAIHKRSAPGSGLLGYTPDHAMIRLRPLSGTCPLGSIGIGRDPRGSSLAPGYRGRPRPAYAGRPA
jgi:hypothetical protein